MLNTAFTGLFSSTGSITVSGFLICIIAALALGLLIAVVHMKTTNTSGSFAVTLAILPAIVSLIIMMVNGSLNKLTYLVTLKNRDSEKEMIDELRCRNGNLEIMVSEDLPVQSEL